MSQTMTETAAPAPAAASSKMPFVFNIQTKNETAFKMKQIATGVHFLSLFLTGFMYILEHEWTKCVGLTSAVAWCLAMFIPPTGLIRPDDAPEYAKNGMSYLPNRDGMGAAGLKLGTEEALKKHPSSKRGGKKKRS